MHHTFHIPVLGLAFSIDTPLKVAQYGITSVTSLVDDVLIEDVRKHYCQQFNIPYQHIRATDVDARAKRITAYLNLLHDRIQSQIDLIKQGVSKGSEDVRKYFRLLPEDNPIRGLYEVYEDEVDSRKKSILEKAISDEIRAGEIEANIMSKVDNITYPSNGNEEAQRLSDACAALRGFANSAGKGSIVLSAGLNPRLYAYLGEFDEFFPDHQYQLKKKVTLKVSDFRSAYIQAKYLAKRGIWISEFRIESGLNCGGHAFVSDGQLMGPILEEFKSKRNSLHTELHELYSASLTELHRPVPPHPLPLRVTYQGGVGTSQEHDFLLRHYGLDSVGWGSPFLLVPEATTVDRDTLIQLANAKHEDYYLSNASPLGILFNNFRPATANQERLRRIEQGRPGAPCTKKFLASNTDLTSSPLCTASRKYQHRKIQEITQSEATGAEKTAAIQAALEKTCLCEGLASAAYLSYGLPLPKGASNSVAICPGPNLANFQSIYSLEDMLSHIYGRTNLMATSNRPHVFINELLLNVDYLEQQCSIAQQRHTPLPAFKGVNIKKFISQLREGIDYYRWEKNFLNDRDLKQMEDAERRIAAIENQLTAV